MKFNEIRRIFLAGLSFFLFVLTLASLQASFSSTVNVFVLIATMEMSVNLKINAVTKTAITTVSVTQPPEFALATLAILAPNVNLKTNAVMSIAQTMVPVTLTLVSANVETAIPVTNARLKINAAATLATITVSVNLAQVIVSVMNVIQVHSVNI